MTDLKSIVSSLSDQVSDIKKSLATIDKYDAQIESFQASANSYYTSYRYENRKSSSDYYYGRYKIYDVKAIKAREAKGEAVITARTMIKSFRKAMDRFETMAKGRDHSIKILKKAIAEQEVIFVQSKEANTKNETNILGTYAKSNFALLKGIIEAVKTGVPKDERVLIKALENVNNDASAHTERMIQLSTTAIDVLIGQNRNSGLREDFKDSSIISSFSTVFDSKMAEMGSALRGESSNIIDTAIQFTLVGVAVEKVFSYMGGKFSNDKK